MASNVATTTTGICNLKITSSQEKGPAVIGHSCCGVPTNVLSVCLFVCLFFGEASKIK